jgi:hypothetical protein
MLLRIRCEGKQLFGCATEWVKVAGAGSVKLVTSTR